MQGVLFLTLFTSDKRRLIFVAHIVRLGFRVSKTNFPVFNFRDDKHVYCGAKNRGKSVDADFFALY